MFLSIFKDSLTSAKISYKISSYSLITEIRVIFAAKKKDEVTERQKFRTGDEPDILFGGQLN